MIEDYGREHVEKLLIYFLLNSFKWICIVSHLFKDNACLKSQIIKGKGL